MSTETSRDLCLRLLDRAGIPIDGPEPWSMQVRDARLWDRLIRDRELGLGESYMDGCGTPSRSTS
jgi:cyclopropane-fatty-acyl-phospholipid synthase